MLLHWEDLAGWETGVKKSQKYIAAQSSKGIPVFLYMYVIWHELHKSPRISSKTEKCQ